MSEPTLLFWTGGWDSTFRLCQLLLDEARSVQPVYVFDDRRMSARRELRTIRTISKTINPRLAPGVALRPLIVRKRADYLIPPRVADRFEALKEQVHIGTQYEWLAAVTTAEGWEGIELCMPRHDPPSALQLALFDDPHAARPQLRSEEPARLFECWTFPVLTLSKTMMGEIAASRGYDDILAGRWVCHRPVMGLACGRCNPCVIASADGVSNDIRFAPKWMTSSVRQAESYGRTAMLAAREPRRTMRWARRKLSGGSTAEM